jgi:nucleotide-binding universal stress UspA family protein
MKQSRIVCGVDGSAGSRVATAVAAELSAALDARLILVHAVHDPPAFPHEAGRRLFEDAATGLDAELRVTLGDPVDGLHAVCDAEEAELLVVGSRGHTGLAAALTGSVSTRVAGSAPCPVVIVPPDAGQRFVARASSGGSIICGYDGSPDAERALEVAVALGERIGLEPLAVFVDPARSWTAATPGPVQILPGDPVRELGECAGRDDARLIAVGSRGRGALRGARLGSVSAALAATAPVPVLVVPPTARVSSRLRVGDGDQSASTSGPAGVPVGWRSCGGPS